MRTSRGETRPGLVGVWDRVVGPRASAVENLVTVGGMVAGALVGASGNATARSWSPPKRLVAALIGADLFGGVWANATPTARWWYHGRGQGVYETIRFSAAHIHPFLVAALYRERDWRYAWSNYAYLLFAAAAISGTPLPQRLAVSLALYCGAAWINLSLWRRTEGMEWFAPVFFLKLLVSHAAGEAPIQQEVTR